MVYQLSDDIKITLETTARCTQHKWVLLRKTLYKCAEIRCIETGFIKIVPQPITLTPLPRSIRFRCLLCHASVSLRHIYENNFPFFFPDHILMIKAVFLAYSRFRVLKAFILLVSTLPYFKRKKNDLKHSFESGYKSLTLIACIQTTD